MPQQYNAKRTLLLNLLFLVVGGAIVTFLWNAPPESTARLPQDETHAAFHQMAKKVAEKECESCHNPEGSAPLPAEHPPKYRCLFCHKR